MLKETSFKKSIYASFFALLVLCLMITQSSYAESNAEQSADTFTTLNPHATLTGNYDYVWIGDQMVNGEKGGQCSYSSTTLSKSLSLPSGSQVVKAYLYWSGTGSLDSQVSFNGTNVNAQHTGTKSFTSGWTNYNYYGGFSEVTNLVAGSGTYNVSGVSFNRDPYCDTGSFYAGYSLLVVYQQSSLPQSTVNVYKGWDSTYGSTYPTSNVTTSRTLAGLSIPTTCTPNVMYTQMLWDGDAYKGEYFYINSNYIGDNTYNGSADYNLDIDSYNVSGYVAGGQNSFNTSTTIYNAASYPNKAYEFAMHHGYVVKVRQCASYSLGDKVFYDTNANGIQDNGEVGVSGVGVQLFNNSSCTGSAVNNTSTNGNGDYLFTSLAAGNYCVKFAYPSDWLLSPSNQGGNDGIDSDANGGGGTATIQNISLNGNDYTQDMGIYRSGKIGDTVWCEQNNNNTYESGVDQPLNGIGVTLSYDWDCNGSADSSAFNTSTNASGQYSFDYLAVGYGNNRTCYVATVNATDSDLGSCNQIVTNGSRAVELTTSNVQDLNADFGFKIPAPTLFKLGDRVFYDTNRNGIQDGGEGGVSNVYVELFNNSSCSGSSTSNTSTNGSGDYLFTGLPASSYCVKFTYPNGYSLTSANQGGNDSADSDATALSGNMATIQNINLSADDLNEDMGLYQSGKIGDTVWCEQNGNTTYEAGSDTPLANIDLTLYSDSDCNGAGDFFLSNQTTNSNGQYLFDNLSVSSNGSRACYTVFVNSTDGDLGSCNQAIVNTAVNVELNPANTQNLSADFGFRTPVSNNPPKVSLNASPVSGNAALNVNFDASGSFAHTGSYITGYSWEFGDGATGSGATVSHIYNTPGTYTARVVVSTNIGLSAERTIEIIVNPAPSTSTWDASVNLKSSRPNVPPSGGYVEYTVSFQNNSSADSWQYPIIATQYLDSLKGELAPNPFTYESDCYWWLPSLWPSQTWDCHYNVFISGDTTRSVTDNSRTDNGQNFNDSASLNVGITEGAGVGSTTYWATNQYAIDNLYQQVDSNGDGTLDSYGIVIGDWNFNGRCDLYEIWWTRECIVLSSSQVSEILNTTNTGDGRYDLLRTLIATWLNIRSGNDYLCGGIDIGINLGVMWLYDYAPSGNPLYGGSPVSGQLWDDFSWNYYWLEWFNETGGDNCAIDRDTGKRTTPTVRSADGEFVPFSTPEVIKELSEEVMAHYGKVLSENPELRDEIFWIYIETVGMVMNDRPVTAEYIERVNAMFDKVYATFDPSLQEQIQLFWSKLVLEQYEGKSARSAWNVLNGLATPDTLVDATELVVPTDPDAPVMTPRIYLPVLMVR